MDAKELTIDQIDGVITDLGCRNAAGGIYTGSVYEFARAIYALAAAPSDELASMTRMFHAACADLGAINETLGLDPDDGGAEPIISAIEELKAQIAAIPSDAAQAPIAWMLQEPGQSKRWYTSGEAAMLHWVSKGASATPLYAAPVAHKES